MVKKEWTQCHFVLEQIRCTSTRATKEVAIIAKDSPALKLGAPHWNGYGTLILLHKWIRILETPFSFSFWIILSYQGAALMMPARSVLQLSWVACAACLYAPPTVSKWAYIQTMTTVNNTANRSSTFLPPFMRCGKYYKAHRKMNKMCQDRS